MRFNFKNCENKLLILFSIAFLLSIVVLYYRDIASREEIRVVPSELDIDVISGEKLLDELKSIDINSADYDELQLLPGIGQILAKRIIEYRNNNGPFLKPEDLLKVEGIGREKLEKIKKFIAIK